MKKFIITFLLLFSTLLFAQDSFWGLAVGVFIPKDAENGLKLGTRFGKQIDEKVSYNLSLDIFRKKEENKEFLTKDATTGVTKSKVSSEYSLLYLPVLLNLSMQLPGGRQAAVKPYLTGGVGLSTLFLSVSNDEQNIDESKFYIGYNLSLGAGLSYKLAERSRVFLEGYYLSGSLVGKKEKVDGYTIEEEIDMGGLGGRCGIRIDI